MLNRRVKTRIRSEPHIEGFKFVKHLGEGGFANTFLYRDLKKKFGEYVVAKIPKDRMREESLIKGDLTSLSALKNSPYIVQYCDIISVGSTYILLMEYVDGPSLRDIIGPVGNGNALPVGKALSYGVQIAEGLRNAHQLNLVHRDIKPDNIIIEKKKDIPMILDFGIATLQHQGGFETVLGRHTPWYTPLEIIMHGQGDQRVDIYGLGVTLFEMMTGVLPYYQEEATEFQLINYITEKKEIPSMGTYRADIPVYLDRIIQKAIAPKQEDRYFSLDDMLSDLAPPDELESARLYFKSGKAKIAEKILLNLMKQRPDDPRIIAELALLKNRCHNFRKALAYYQKALQLDPGNPELLKKTGVVCKQTGDKDKARHYLHRALRAAVNDKEKRSIERLLKSFS